MAWVRSNKKSSGGGGSTYANISDFAFYFKRNTSTPTVTKISDYEFSISYNDTPDTGYELCSFSVSLPKGVYVAEIKATINKNTGLANDYLWGIYTCSSSSDAQRNDQIVRTDGTFTSYVPFDKSDTAEHTYYVPILMRSNGTGYICFGTSADTGVNASIVVSSLKIKET